VLPSPSAVTRRDRALSLLRTTYATLPTTPTSRGSPPPVIRNLRELAAELIHAALVWLQP
jgi:hypothetical protein